MGRDTSRTTGDRSLGRLDGFPTMRFHSQLRATLASMEVFDAVCDP